MADILIRAGCFVAIIALGIFLRKIGLFQRSDSAILSKVVLKITLPASIIASFSDKELSVSMLTLALLGFAAGICHMVVAWITTRKRGRDQLAFSLINLTGYNIGTFSLPFIQSFLGPSGVITAGLFDIGMAAICLGTSFGVAKIVKDGSGFSLRTIGKNVLKSVPLICYFIMVLLRLAGLSLPAPVVSLAQLIGSANPFLAMLMIGIGFRISAERAQLNIIVRHLIIRYAMAAAAALLFWFILPFGQEVRQVLVILSFSPLVAAAPAYTAELGSDVGLASAINSLTIVISVVIMTALLTALF